MLTIRFLGKSQLIQNGEDITAALGSKACALLCFLFLRREKYAAREKIAAYLWPDSAADAAKYNLRYNLWMIKKFTDEDEKGSSLIRLDREYCGINEAYDYTCDIQRVMAAEGAGASLEELQTLHELFRGELLEGCYFSNCDELNELILNRRIYFEKMKGRILGRIAELYEQEGQNEQAIGVLEEIMEDEPYNEVLAMKLMKLYASAGNRSAAISFYHVFRGRLASSLEINPGRALYEKYMELKSETGEDGPEKPRESEAEKDGSIELETFCIREIPCFWMADAVKGILQAIGPEFSRKISRETLRNLGAIQPEALSYLEDAAGEEATMAAIGQSFISLVTQTASCAPLTILVRNSGQIDDISGAILKYLQNCRPKGLVIRTE